MDRVWRVATGGWMALVLMGSMLPPTVGAPGGPFWHLAGYGVLGALLARGRATAPAWLIGTGYGAFVEGLQWLMRYRTAEAGDLVVNAVGVAIGLAAVRLAERVWPKPGSAPPPV